jgi:hypothetical protein
MTDEKKCPKCGSKNLSMEKCLNCNTHCLDCGYSGSHGKFHVKCQGEEVRYITHTEIRKAISTWSREAREMMRLYVDQQENSAKFTKAYNEDMYQLLRLYDQLLGLRNEQLKDVPFSVRGTTVELDVHVCKKIAKLRLKMGLPVED